MLIIFKIFLVLFFTACYAIGGEGPKWVRRFLGSIVFGAGLILLSILSHKFGIWILLGAAWYCPSLLIFKYGVNDGNVTKKILLRGIYGTSLGLAGLLVSISGHHAISGLLNLIAATGNTIWLGVKNPFSNDPKLRILIIQNQNLQNLPVILEDVCIILGAIAIIPFLI